MEDKRQKLGGYLRRRRLAVGLSQQQLAEASGLSIRSIGDLERGSTRWPYPDSLRRLADALHIQDQERQELFRAGRRHHAASVVVDGQEAQESPHRPGTIVPRQLPAPVRHFTGRADELAALAGLLDRAGKDSQITLVISAIGGLAGVGKTALAIQWAHQVAGEFPDGQLYVNLRGYDPALPPMPAAEAVRLFLDAFEIPARRIPASAEGQAGLYRSVLVGKKVLILADNAVDAAQVRPLLPGSSGCLVLVTSRSSLAGLIATDGAVPLSLDVLTEVQARDLLDRILGDARIAAEPDAARQLIELCGRLPLALAITAARAATRPKLSLKAVAAELGGAASRLDALQAAGDPPASIRTALDCSYDHLSAGAAAMLRLLAMHPGPEISTPAAASLTGHPVPRAARHLAELADASLIMQHATGRCSLHDLIRLYAAEQVRQVASPDERDAATGRMLDHYLHTGAAAALLLSPEDPIAIALPSAGTVTEFLSDYGSAMSWFKAEHQVLIAVIGYAAAAGQDARTWTICCTLRKYLERRGHLQEHLTISATALAAAERLGDLTLQTKSHLQLASAAASLRRDDHAESHFRHALDLSRQVGDRNGQAAAYLGLSDLLDRHGELAQAADNARHALELFIAAGDVVGQASTLNNIGWILIGLEDYEQALACCRQGLALSRNVGGRMIEAATLDTIGHAYRHLGQHADAIAWYQQALELVQELGGRYRQTEALRHLGDTYQAAGNLKAARRAWRSALTILDEMQHPDAEQVCARFQAAGYPLSGRAMRPDEQLPSAPTA